jgi:magnesium transporter
LEEVRIEEITLLITQMLRDKNFKGLKDELAALYPMDIAEVFDDLDPEDCVILFRLLQKDQAAEVFSYLSPQRQKDIVGAIHVSLLNYIFNELYFDDKIDFLEDMPANFVKKLIAAAPAEERGLINQFLNYPDNSAGSLMTIEFTDLKKNMTVKEALARIKRTAVDKETIYTCYVLDDTRRLEGIVSLRRLVLSEEDQIISDIMTKDVVLCGTNDDQEEVVDLFKKYDLMAIPVVDSEQRLVGIITIDDIVDVIEQENTEDFLKMAAMAPSDDAYLSAGVFTLAKQRIPWLLILMISATFTGAIIGYYENLLSTVVVLTAFIPMLMDSGGNSGNQSSTLIIRGIALGEISLRDWPKVLWKEFRVSLIAGSVLAVINFLRMVLFDNGDLMIKLTVCATLFFAVVIAKLIGSLLPIAAKTLKLDPAIMAGPFITTLVDAIVLFIYFGIARVLIF